MVWVCILICVMKETWCIPTQLGQHTLQVNDCIESSTHFQKNSEGLSRSVELFAVVLLPQR